jgi:hypothetical protein
MEDDERLCRKCGESVKRTAQKCPLCGINAPAIPSEADKAQGRLGCLLIFLFTLVAIVVLTLIVMIGIGHHPN